LRRLGQKATNNPRVSEVFRFVVNGVVSFLVDYGLLYSLTEFAGMHYLWSSALSFIASVMVNYWICVVWVFEGVGKTGKKTKLIFLASSVAGLGINQGLMWLLVDKADIYYMAAKIIATAAVMAWNYVMKRKALYLG